MKLACFNTQSPPQYAFNCCIITDTLIIFFTAPRNGLVVTGRNLWISWGNTGREMYKKKLSKQSRKIVEHLSGKWLPRESQGVDV